MSPYKTSAAVAIEFSPTAPAPGVPAARRGSRSVAILVWSCLLALVAATLLSAGVEAALHFLGSAIDGPFQLYNALRRIAAGQRPGVDFQFFHGMALPYLHYLPFRLLGGSFMDSEVTRQIVTIVVFPLVLLPFFRTFTRDWPRTIVLSTVVLALSIALRLTSILVAINSLLGVRSALPTLVPAIMCLRLRPTPRSVLVGIALGGSILLGTEQGLAVTLAFALVSVVVLWRRGEQRAYAVEMAITLAAMVLTVVGVGIALGGIAGMKGALYYNLKLVPMDQYWYFGSPPNVFFNSWHAVPFMLRDQPRMTEAIIVAMLVTGFQLRRLWRDPDGDAGRRHAALSILVLYGLISCTSLLGILAPGYVQPCIRTLLIVAALELDRILPAYDIRRQRAPVLQVSRTLVMILGAALVVMTVSVTTVITAFITTIPHIIKDHIIHGEGVTWAGIWPQTLTDGQAVFDRHRGPKGEPPTIWSTYGGLLEAQNGVYSASSFDYIIHALGPQNRERYVQQFRAVKPTLVQTVMPSYTSYELWIEQTSWDFYAELLRNYRLAGATQWSIFWERLATPHDSSPVYWSSAVPASATSVDIPSPVLVGQSNVALLQVELDYRVHNPFKAVPILGGMPRYLVSVDNAVSRYPVTLDPYTRQARFPVVAVRGSNPKLLFETYSLLPRASVEVSAVRVSRIPINDDNAAWLMNLIQKESERLQLLPGHRLDVYKWR